MTEHLGIVRFGIHTGRTTAKQLLIGEQLLVNFQSRNQPSGFIIKPLHSYSFTIRIRNHIVESWYGIHAETRRGENSRGDGCWIVRQSSRKREAVGTG